ncbi:MAG TPA: hypothetical protein VFG14_06235, partial [Chthoniobacteraceae bacterium]|nr:hypothetical protein [Chthoniobacteraceae bacterium]
AALDAARRAPSRDVTAPFGFAGRVVALYRSNPAASSTFLLWWKFTWRAIGVAALVLVAAAALNFTGSGDSALDPAIADSMGDLLYLP